MCCGLLSQRVFESFAQLRPGLACACFSTAVCAAGTRGSMWCGLRCGGGVVWTGRAAVGPVQHHRFSASRHGTGHQLETKRRLPVNSHGLHTADSACCLRHAPSKPGTSGSCRVQRWTQRSASVRRRTRRLLLTRHAGRAVGTPVLAREWGGGRNTAAAAIEKRLKRGFQEKACRKMGVTASGEVGRKKEGASRGVRQAAAPRRPLLLQLAATGV